MRKILAAMVGLVLVLGLLAGCGGSQKETPKETPKETGATQPAKAEKLKVAFVYVGPVGDGGWTYAHDMGRKELEKALGDKIETTFIESVPEGADSERVMEELVQKGYKVIFATSYGYMDPMLTVAKKHPDVIFMHNSGYKTNPNMGTYFGRNHEAFYLAGIVAGMQTKNNTIGMVAAFPIPEVIRAINALALGARSVNPKATVRVVWTNTWYDPAKEKSAALSLLDTGSDLITMYQDSPGPLQAAQERGKTAIGNDTDSRQYAPKAFLTAPIWNWGPYYVKTVQSVLDKSWKSGQYWGHMSDGIVDLAPLSDLADPAAKPKVEEARKKIVGGYEIFTGPIKDQSGKVKVAEGQKMTDEQLLSMDWFVEGVMGTTK